MDDYDRAGEPFKTNQYICGPIREGLWVITHRNYGAGHRFSFWWERYGGGLVVPFLPGDREAMEAWQDWYYRTH